MASSEPTLAPEWLKSNGHGSSGGSAGHHFASVNSHSDAPLLANSSRNRSSRTNTDIGSPRAILDRSSSISSRKNSSSNGSSKHPYSSFSRSHRDKEREKEKERSALGDFWERANFESLGKDPLSRSHSMVARKQGDSFPLSDASVSRKIESNKDLQSNDVATGDKPSSSVTKISFENDFPSLGADEKRVPNVVRVASPGLTITHQGLPIGNSALSGEGWSALAEVPVLSGSNNNEQSIHQLLATSVASSTTSGVLSPVSDAANSTSCDSNTASVAPTTGASGPSSGLNMAEALIQPPPATCTVPQLSVETQRLEQLALKKVKLLIPVTPAMPKVLNSSDKFKSKLNARFGEISGAKAGLQPPPSSVSVVGRSPRGGPVNSDASKKSHGNKLFVLKPPWENSASVTSKDGSNPENGAGRRQTNSIVPGPAVSSNPARSSNNSKASVMERRSVVSPSTMASSVEKRPFSSYAKSRSDFFNSVRKKTSITTAVPSETSASTQPLTDDKSCEVASESPRGTENGGSVQKNDSSDEDRKLSTRENNSILCSEVIPDEEEVAFLRSLGWQEDDDEEEGLTEEEINAFYQGVMKLKPPLNISQGMQPALSLLMESHASKVGVASPRVVSSSDAAALKSN